jgi:hypothetical protein
MNCSSGSSSRRFLRHPPGLRAMAKLVASSLRRGGHARRRAEGPQQRAVRVLKPKAYSGLRVLGGGLPLRIAGRLFAHFKRTSSPKQVLN